MMGIHYKKGTHLPLDPFFVWMVMGIHYHYENARTSPPMLGGPFAIDPFLHSFARTRTRTRTIMTTPSSSIHTRTHTIPHTITIMTDTTKPKQRLRGAGAGGAEAGLRRLRKGYVLTCGM